MQLKGEDIEAYKCDHCDKSVTLNKRLLLGDMPNVLILHLNRICLDFETFMPKKINTRLEFPKILDLKKYSCKG